MMHGNQETARPGCSGRLRPRPVAKEAAGPGGLSCQRDLIPHRGRRIPGDLLARVLAGLLAVIVLSSSTTRAQQFELPDAGHPFAGAGQTGLSDWQFGFQIFQLLLEQKGMRTGSNVVSALTEHPRATVLVLLSDVPQRRDFWRAVQRFVDRGGAALVASDRRVSGTGFTIDGALLETDDAELTWQGYSDVLRVRELNPRHSVLEGVDELIANRASWISGLSGNAGRWTILANFPASLHDARVRRRQLPWMAEMQSRHDPNGRLLVMADHSLLINGMLWHGDNAQLAVNVVDRLTDDGRTRVVFSLDGDPLPSMLPQPEMPEPENLPPPTLEDLANLPRETLLRFANRFITGLEDADVLNELVAGQPSRMEPPLYRQALFLGAAALVAFHIVRLLSRAGQRPEKPSARAAGIAPGGAPPGAPSGFRLRLATTELARELFRQLSGSDDPQDWVVAISDVEVDGNMLRRYAVRSRLKRFRLLASSAYRSPVSRRDFKRLGKEMKELLEMHRRGELRHPLFVTQYR